MRRYYTFAVFVDGLELAAVCKSSELQNRNPDSLDREHLASYRLTDDALEDRSRVG
jgi:hypothetical protein